VVGMDELGTMESTFGMGGQDLLASSHFIVRNYFKEKSFVLIMW